MEKYHPFFVVIAFLVGGTSVVATGLFLSKMMRPSNPGAEKLATYECGEDTIGSAWGSFNTRYYLLALLFVLFEVELVLLLPFALVYADKDLIASTGGIWGWTVLIEILIFIGMLVIGLAWAWKHGFLEWTRPTTSYENRMPKMNSIYERFNKKY